MIVFVSNMAIKDRETHLNIVYDGPAVADGSMNVRDLAPAMLAIGSLFEAANNVTNGQRARVNIKVRATSSGSFHILYEVLQASETIDPGLLTTAVGLKELLVGSLVVGGSL